MENLKEVDWSKAPEGATHYSTESLYPWLKETPASYFVEDREVWVKYRLNGIAMIDLRNAIKRTQEWDGGVPPIGTVCEYYWTGGEEWRKCEVVAHYFASVIAVDVLDGTATRLHSGLFRPIKTPEQIAAEERLQTIDEMLDLVGRYSTFKDVMSELYDAGYRKTEDKLC